MNLVKPTTDSMKSLPVYFPKSDLRGRATGKDYALVVAKISIVVAISAIIGAVFAFSLGHPVGLVFGAVALIAVLISSWERDIIGKFDDEVRKDALFRRQGYCALYVHPFMAEHGYELSGNAAQLLIEGNTVEANTGEVMTLDKDVVLLVIG